MIYICFGMTKSASTFLYQLTEQTFRVGGRDPARLPPPFRPRGAAENYFDDIDPPLLDEVAKAAHGRDVVLKTHQGLHPGVARRIEAGEVLASVSVRDPREVALSMVDHGRKSARRGLTEFSECRTARDAWPSLDHQVANLGRWSALKAAQVFRYNETCFETASVVSRIAAQIGVAVEVSAALAPFRNKRRIGQFNRGRPCAIARCRRTSRRRFSSATPGSTRRSGSIPPPPRPPPGRRRGQGRAAQASCRASASGGRSCSPDAHCALSRVVR